jgi:hypothetical protein
MSKTKTYIFPYELIKEMTVAILGKATIEDYKKIEKKYGGEFSYDGAMNDSLNEGYLFTDNIQFNTRLFEIPDFGTDQKGNGYLYFENSEDYDFLDVKTMLGVGFRGEGIEPKNPKELERILDLIEEKYEGVK